MLSNRDALTTCRTCAGEWGEGLRWGDMQLKVVLRLIDVVINFHVSVSRAQAQGIKLYQVTFIRMRDVLSWCNRTALSLIKFSGGYAR